MKIRSINNIKGFENKEAYIQYLLMNDDVSKIQETLNSLDNSLSVTEALKTANTLIEKNKSLSSLLSNVPEKDRKDIVLNILSYAFMNNNDFNKELELFVRKKSPVIVRAKVEAGIATAEAANKTYRPINNIDYNGIEGNIGVA